MAVKPESQSFEKALARLEDIVDRLESGDVPLADAVKLFEEGIALRKRCLELLTEAEQKVRFLTAAADGEPSEEDPPADWVENDDDD
jgi:exodeoxyribonuclease VII small subunit